MAIPRVTTQGAYTPSMPQETQALSMRQSLDRLAQHHDAQSDNNACCIIRCFRRICDYLVSIFRCLFGGSQTQETTTRPTPSDLQQPARPEEPAKPVISETPQQPQAKLEEGMFVSDRVIEKIKEFMPVLTTKDMRKGKGLATLELLLHSSRELVFVLTTTAPYFVFKRGYATVDAEERTERHFANMIKAQEVCTKHNLNLLVIPHATKFKIDDMTFIAQERLNLDTDESQEQHYKLSGLDEVVRQLAIFIKETGFSDVVWRNIPILDTDLAFPGSRRVALIDLEHMDKADDGFYGNYGAPGLIGCLFYEKQIDNVISVIKRYGIVSPYTTPEQAKDKRMIEIQEDRDLHAFYKENGILNDPGKPIVVPDLTALGLDLDEQATIPTIKNQVTLRQAAEYVIAKINNKIAEHPFKGSVKAKRSILLSPKGDATFNRYNDLGLPPPPADNPYAPITQKELMQRWPWRTISALVKHRYIFKLVRENGHGYFIQA